MARDDKDRSSKWLLKHHGDSILRLAEYSGVQSWTSSQSDLTLPRQMPDACLSVTFDGSADPTPVLIEVATYPSNDVAAQLVSDLMMVYLHEGVMPDATVLVLRPKGNLAVPDTVDFPSAQGSVQSEFSWRVVNLWEVDAEDLLSADEVGLIPWIPLTQFDESPHAMLTHCRERIDQSASPHQVNLLAVCQVMTRLRYNDDTLMEIFGGRKIMIESPLIQELMDEAETKGEARGVQQTRCEDILAFLAFRFGAIPGNMRSALEKISDLGALAALRDTALSCQSLDEFEAALPNG